MWLPSQLKSLKMDIISKNPSQVHCLPCSLMEQKTLKQRHWQRERKDIVCVWMLFRGGFSVLWVGSYYGVLFVCVWGWVSWLIRVQGHLSYSSALQPPLRTHTHFLIIDQNGIQRDNPLLRLGISCVSAYFALSHVLRVHTLIWLILTLSWPALKEKTNRTARTIPESMNTNSGTIEPTVWINDRLSPIPLASTHKT